MSPFKACVIEETGDKDRLHFTVHNKSGEWFALHDATESRGMNER